MMRMHKTCHFIPISPSMKLLPVVLPRVLSKRQELHLPIDAGFLLRFTEPAQGGEPANRELDGLGNVGAAKGWTGSRQAPSSADRRARPDITRRHRPTDGPDATR